MPSPQKLLKSLEEYGVDSDVISRIRDGYDGIRDNSTKKVRTAFMRHAMRILDEALEPEKRYEVIDSCACCLGGKRAEAVKQFVKSMAGQDLTLAEKVEALRKARPFYNNTRLNDDGTITDGVYYQVDGRYRCPCPGLDFGGMSEPISRTYCLCCGGHFRHHIQKALGIKLKTKQVASSALESLGKEPCVFVFEVVTGSHGSRRQCRDR